MPIHLADVVAPVVVAMLFIGATSAFKEPQRRHFNAIMIAGAGAAYLNGGLGLWEFVFTAVVTYCAYQGLNAYGFIGLGWLLHTGWDIIHHLYKPRQNIIYLSAELNRLCRIRVSTDISIRDLSPVSGLILPLYSVVAHRNATSRVQSI
jgi:hypothetical protein